MGTADDGPHGIAADGPECPESACVTGDWELSLVLSPQWAVPLRAHFSYRADDPYAVSLDFYLSSHRPVRWIFARDLLVTGLTFPAGQGDVRVRPDQDGTLVSLCLESQQGDALFEMSVAPLIEWLERTYELVPPGQERRFLELDALVERLLCEPWVDGEEGDGWWEDGPYEHPGESAGHPPDSNDGPEDAQGTPAGS